jgi:hypothetical protein
MVQDRTKGLALGLAASQLVDAIANELVPRRYVKAHLDHLGVPERLQSGLPVIKVASSVGLLLGTKLPRLGVMTSAGLVAYYAAAVGFHVLAHDHPVVSVPAAIFGASAAVALVSVYLPAVARP